MLAVSPEPVLLDWLMEPGRDVFSKSTLEMGVVCAVGEKSRNIGTIGVEAFRHIVVVPLRRLQAGKGLDLVAARFLAAPDAGECPVIQRLDRQVVLDGAPLEQVMGDALVCAELAERLLEARRAIRLAGITVGKDPETHRFLKGGGSDAGLHVRPAAVLDFDPAVVQRLSKLFAHRGRRYRSEERPVVVPVLDQHPERRLEEAEGSSWRKTWRRRAPGDLGGVSYDDGHIGREAAATSPMCSASSRWSAGWRCDSGSSMARIRGPWPIRVIPDGKAADDEPRPFLEPGQAVLDPPRTPDIGTAPAQLDPQVRVFVFIDSLPTQILEAAATQRRTLEIERSRRRHDGVAEQWKSPEQRALAGIVRSEQQGDGPELQAHRACEGAIVPEGDGGWEHSRRISKGGALCRGGVLPSGAV